MNKIIIFLIMGLLCSSTIWAGEKISPEMTSAAKEKLAAAQIPFIKNEGQIKAPEVKFYAKTFNGTIFITDKGDFVYNIAREKYYLGADDYLSLGAFPLSGFTLKETPVRSPDADDLQVYAVESSPTIANYFIGNSSENWRSEIPTYNIITLGQVWKGITLNLKASDKNIEKVFVVNPGSDVDSISFRMDGIDGLAINSSGELEVKTLCQSIVGFSAPVAFQEINGAKKNVDVSYRLIGKNRYGFKVGNYDKSLPLVIDPVLSSTFIGGSGVDVGTAIAIDPANGNIFICGYTVSSNYPTLGEGGAAYDSSPAYTYDCVVSKFTPTLTGTASSSTGLIASTYLGSNLDTTGSDAAFDIALDGNGNVFICGQATLGFPTATDAPADWNTRAFDTSFNGPSFPFPEIDCFVAKFNNGLTRLLASTYLGSAGPSEAAQGIAIDDTNNVFVCGYTDSDTFPTFAQNLTGGLINSYDTSYNGGIDCFVSKFNNYLSATAPSYAPFYYSGTFIGGVPYAPGTGVDLAFDIALDTTDSINNVFITGFTVIGQPDYPVTSGAYDTTRVDVTDAFISKFNSTLTELLASTLLGGGSQDVATAMVINLQDPLKSIYVTGTTGSDDFPIPIGSYTPGGPFPSGSNPGLGAQDIFVARLSNTLGSLLNSCWIGGGDSETPNGICIGSVSNDVYICGQVESLNYPVAEGVFQPNNAGSTDAFITSFNDTLTVLNTSTFVGGGGGDIANDIIAGSGGEIIIVGQAAVGYPVYQAYDTTFNGSSDIFVTRISADLSAGYLQPPPQEGEEGPVLDTTEGEIVGSSTVYALGSDAFTKPIGSCFIATAVYGNPSHPNVMALRNFRDNYLLTNTPGRYLVKEYYRMGPAMAENIKSSPVKTGVVRMALTPFVYSLKYPLYAFGLVLLMLLGFYAIYFKKSKIQES